MEKPNDILLQGPIKRRCGFSVINRQIVDGLSKLGYKVRVLSMNYGSGEYPRGGIPDVYIFHGNPFDFKNAPAKLNIFFMEWEYFNMSKEWVRTLNERFDAMLVPSNLSKRVCRDSGIKIPIKVFPSAVDKSIFNRRAVPVRLPSSKSFKFIYLGGAHDRRGTDLLLKAYTEEFSASEDVSLVIKAFAYEHLKPWVDSLVSKVNSGKKKFPEIIYMHKETRSVAGYFTASDAGVFPLRAECLGMPVLECIACGRPVIVTEGTSLHDFCNKENTLFIKAKKVTRGGNIQLEPDKKHLRQLMRKVFEQGKLSAKEQLKLSRSTNGLSWEKSVNVLDLFIQKEFVKKKRLKTQRVRDENIFCLGYSYAKKGRTSWMRTGYKIDSALKKNFDNYYPSSLKHRNLVSGLDVIMGQSQFCLEHFISNDDPHSLRILYRESGPLEFMLDAINRERRRCHVAPIVELPVELWRNYQECRLADRIFVFSKMSKSLFIKSGYPEEKLEILHRGIDVDKPYIRKMTGKVRFLFAGPGDPFRKGIRLLLKAWDELKPANAELVCIVNEELFNSRSLMKYLVKNPDIAIKLPMPHKGFLKELIHADCQVLPSLEDGAPLVIGEGMGRGKPAIISSSVGSADMITHLQDGYIVKPGSAAELKEAISYFCKNKKKIAQMGEAAYETAKQYSWKRFEKRLVELIVSLYNKKIGRGSKTGLSGR